MAWTKYQLFLAGLLVFTGSLNTMATKFADKQTARGRDGGVWFNKTVPENTTDPHPFEHPFLQATGMFLGEFTCLIFFKIMMFIHSKRNTPEDDLPGMLQGNRDFNPFIFYLPAACDMIGTSLMYIGLGMTYASSFQMFRGAVIIFTGIFSMIFLKRKLHIFKWLGIICVLAGLCVVGMADIFFPDPDADEGTKSSSSIITGDLIIVCAQVVTATQMVLEEKFVSQSNVPALQAVGWEGLFGMCTLGVLLIPMYFIKIGGAPIEDSIDGLLQMWYNPLIALGFGGTLISISFFNFAGVSVTKQMSATTRMVLDSVRTLIIWVLSMAIRWQKFQLLTLGGFVVLLVGMAIYNNLFPCLKEPEEERDEEA